MLTEATQAALELVGRTGAQSLEVGYLNDTPLAEDADWYAHAQYRGARITVEHHRGPAQALEALAGRLLTGAQCAHCGSLVALSDRGAAFYPSSTLVDGSLWDEQTVRQVGQCRWRRVGARWVEGCKLGAVS
jgi:hypothetical protein